MRVVRRIAATVLALGLAACSGGPSFKEASLEGSPLASRLADPAKAFTFAQVGGGASGVRTVLVTAYGRADVEAVDLTALGAGMNADIFDVMDRIGDRRLRDAFAHGARRSYAIAQLAPVAGNGQRHVATAINFREPDRSEETDNVFLFPKFGTATAARTQVTRLPGALLDYEVEICARFDRTIRTIADFDAARKGFFLCGDFTDRATLMRRVDPRDVTSGEGFTDAKSAADFFPTGPFLVVPRDWRAFVATERVVTYVNGAIRQDARGGEMRLDFRALVAKALRPGGRYSYRGARIPLLEGDTIPRGATVMSGTSEGVIFAPPRMTDYFKGGAQYIFTGPMLDGKSPYDTMVETYVKKLRASGRFLKPGDVVAHDSSSLGDIKVRVMRLQPTPIQPVGNRRTTALHREPLS